MEFLRSQNLALLKKIVSNFKPKADFSQNRGKKIISNSLGSISFYISTDTPDHQMIYTSGTLFNTPSQGAPHFGVPPLKFPMSLFGTWDYPVTGAPSGWGCPEITEGPVLSFFVPRSHPEHYSDALLNSRTHAYEIIRMLHGYANSKKVALQAVC